MAFKIDENLLCDLDVAGSVDECIEVTDEAPNGFDTFKTFGEAKKKVISEIESRVWEWRNALKEARKLKKADIEPKE